MTKKQQKIINTYRMIEIKDPEISTERLFAMIMDETGADACEIADALRLISTDSIDSNN